MFICVFADKHLSRAFGDYSSSWSIVAHELAQLPLTLVNARHLVSTLQQGDLVVHMTEEDRRALLLPLQRWLRITLLIALAFYLRGFHHPSAGWLSIVCFVAAALRLLWKM